MSNLGNNNRHILLNGITPYYKYLLLLILVLWYGFFIIHKINFSTADLGRHIKNGEIILKTQSGFLSNKVLTQNFYSYTEPNYSFVNHHWGSGVIFYLTLKYFGFSGVSILFIFLSFLSLIIFYDVARRESNLNLAFLVAIIFIPIISQRKEIRPEVFGYLFSGIFLWILTFWDKNKLNKKWLFVLPILGLVWINLHITYIFGLFIVGVFLVEKIFQMYFKKENNLEQIGTLSMVFVLMFLLGMLNPFGIKAILYPLNIFRNYGYTIVENQSIWFLENYGIKNPRFLFFKVTYILILLTYLKLIISKRNKIAIRYLMFFIVFSSLGLLALRNFVNYGFFSIVILSTNIYAIFEDKNILNDKIIAFTTSVFVVLLMLFHFNNIYPIKYFKRDMGIGLKKNVNSSMQFIKTNKLMGPIFNNYDNGGQLIYHLYPQYKVFVDNRPEAYSEDFLQKVYIPMQQNEVEWKKYSTEYGFNTVVFQYHDATGWGQTFLINRVNDPEWIPVFVDNYNLIFLKNNEYNKDIIRKYKLPKELFRVVKK
ncbi:hypothetical protein ACFL4A_01805 [bacterium]